MKLAIYSLPVLLSLATTGALFGALESAVNLIEGLRLLFAPGATTVIFTPFLILFILLGLGAFVLATLLAASLGAGLGGLLLRRRGLPASPIALRLLVPAAVACHFVFVLLATHYDSALLLDRPRQHPHLPGYALACIAGADGALAAWLAAWIFRRIALGRTPPPIPRGK